MTLGSSDTTSFYIVRKSDDVAGPLCQAVFCDYSKIFLKWDVSHNVSQVAVFEGLAASTSLCTCDFKAGNLLYMMSGTTLISKFVIDRPIYKGNSTVLVKGFQSTGNEIENRKILTENTPNIDFQGETLCNILTCQGGILTDNESHVILPIGNLTGGSLLYNFKSDRLNRLKSVSKIGNITNHEWLMCHGTNDATPYSEGDTLDFKDRIGSASGYCLRLCGTGLNASGGSGNNESLSIVNDVFISGTDINGNQISTELYDSTGTCTKTNGALDGWVYEEVVGAENVFTFCGLTGTPTAGAYFCLGSDSLCGGYLHSNITGDQWNVSNLAVSSFAPIAINGINLDGSEWSGTVLSLDEGVGSKLIKVRKGHGFTGLTSFLVKIDSEKIRIDCLVSDTNYDKLYVCDDGRGSSFMGTIATSHKINSDITNVTTGAILTVDCTAGFATTCTRSLKIGDEIIPYTNQDGTTFTTARVFENAYAHGDEVRVQQYEEDGDCYTKNCWDTGTVNSIRTNGIHSQSRADNSAGTHNELDLKAQSIIENKGTVNRISIDIADEHDFFDTVGIGDSVCVINGDFINISDACYRFTGYKFSFDYGRISLTGYFNDDDIRTYPLTEYSYVDMAEEQDESKRQEPQRANNTSVFTTALAAGVEQAVNQIAQYKNIIDPTDVFDAVNKKYVDSKFIQSGAGGTLIACATCIFNSLDGVSQGYDSLDICAGSNMTITTNGSGVYTFCSTASGSSFWADGTNPYVILDFAHSACGLCMFNNIVDGDSTNCLGCAGSPGSWKEVHALCVMGATCLKSDTVCGTSSVITPILNGVCVCATCWVQALDVLPTSNATGCVGLADGSFKELWINCVFGTTCVCSGVVSGCCVLSSRLLKLPVGTNCY